MVPKHVEIGAWSDNLLRFESLLIEISSKFVDVSTDKVDDEIERAQCRICAYLDLDRSTLWQHPLAEPSVLSLTHVYQRPGSPAVPARADGQTLFPWGFRQLQRGEAIVLSDLDDLPSEAARDKESWRRFGAVSTVVVPLSIGGVGFGGLSFASLRQRREWSETLLKQLRLVAQVFAGALHRARSDQELRESRDRYALAVEGASDGLWDWDILTNKVYFSPRWKGMLGYADHEVPNSFSAWEGLLHPDDRDRALESIQAYLAGGVPLYEVEHRLRGKDGGYRWILARGKALRDAEGRPYRMAGSHSDITERRQAVEALRDDEQRLLSIYNTVEDAIFHLDVEAEGQYRFASINQSFSRATGLRQEQVVGKTVTEVITGPSLTVVLGKYRQAIDTKTLVRWEEVTDYPSGRLIGEVSVTPIFDDKGKCTHLVGSVHNITERKQAEEALRQRNQYIETVLEEAPIGFAVHTIDDGVGRFVSARYEEIYGVARGEIDSHQTFFDKVWPNHPELRAQIRRRVLADMASGDARRMQWDNVPVVLASGETRYISAMNIPLVEQNMAVSTVQDVTERIRAEQGLRESVLRFQQVAEVTNDFIWEVDVEGLYTYTSPSVQKILGYAPEELVGKMHFYDLFAPDVRADLKAAAFEGFAARCSFKDFYNLNVSKDGRLVHLETSGIPLLDEAGNLVGYRGADTDVTARKESEEKLRQAYEELKELRDQLQQQNVYLRQEVRTLHGHTHVVGQSFALQKVLSQAEQVAPTGSTVLILGETGTGKELIASTIHELSPRADHAMVRVNCSAIPASLIESELFGREKGAYTGALSKQIGRFETAHKSTLFLDEIGDLPTEVQVKLLRVLQERQIERLGSSKPINVDVRIIAATNKDLDRAVREGKFRQDLYYRLNVFPITVPPLRERREDIPPLVSTFVAEFSAAFGKNIESISKESLDKLQRYSWPGNVRELRNVIERAMIVATGPTLWIDRPDPALSESTPSLNIWENEIQLIRNVLEMAGWRIRGRNGAAEILGLKPTTLESRMTKLGIRRANLDATK